MGFRRRQPMQEPLRDIIQLIDHEKTKVEACEAMCSGKFNSTKKEGSIDNRYNIRCSDAPAAPISNASNDT